MDSENLSRASTSLHVYHEEWFQAKINLTHQKVNSEKAALELNKVCDLVIRDRQIKIIRRYQMLSKIWSSWSFHK